MTEARKFVIVGAGGHAREVLQILLARRASGEPVEPLGFVVDDPGDGGRSGLPVLGDFGWLAGLDRAAVEVICAVGTPALNRELVERMRALGFRFGRAISPLAWMADSATVGEGTIVFPQVVINADAVVGDHVTLNVAATVSHDARVGDFATVGPGAHLAGNVTVGEGCFIGMGADVIQGVTIGDRSVIGAGAAVIDDLPADVTAVGVPARVVGPATPNPMARPRHRASRAGRDP